MRRLHLILALLVAVAAGISWWLGSEDDPAAVTANPGSPGPREVDYRIDGFELVRMTATGTPAHRFEAAQDLDVRGIVAFSHQGRLPGECTPRF